MIRVQDSGDSVVLYEQARYDFGKIEAGNPEISPEPEFSRIEDLLPSDGEV